MEHFEDPEAAAWAILRWAENRSSRKMAILREQLKRRDAEVERLNKELMDTIHAVRKVTASYADFKHLLSREAI